MSITDICICGTPIDAHTTAKGRRRTCEEARRHSGYQPVNVGTLLRLAVDRHTRAKQETIDSIRSTGATRGWSVRLGGRFKGFTVHAKTLVEMHALIDAYYQQKWAQRRLRRT